MAALENSPCQFPPKQHSPEMARFSSSYHHPIVPGSLVFFFSNQYPFESISLLFKMHFFKATGEDKHFKVGLGIICISPFFGEQSFLPFHIQGFSFFGFLRVLYKLRYCQTLMLKILLFSIFSSTFVFI